MSLSERTTRYWSSVLDGMCADLYPTCSPEEEIGEYALGILRFSTTPWGRRNGETVVECFHHDDLEKSDYNIRGKKAPVLVKGIAKRKTLLQIAAFALHYAGEEELSKQVGVKIGCGY